MNETLGKIHFWITFVGAYCIFMPFHYLGLAGNVRRYQAFVVDYMRPLIPVHQFITIAALVTGAAQLIFLFNLFYSRFKGEPAPQIHGKLLHSNGALRLRRRPSTTSAANCRWFTTIPINMGLKDPLATT